MVAPPAGIRAGLGGFFHALDLAVAAGDPDLIECFGPSPASEDPDPLINGRPGNPYRPRHVPDTRSVGQEEQNSRADPDGLCRPIGGRPAKPNPIITVETHKNGPLPRKDVLSS